MDKNSPIGIFDSGVGGLSVVRQIIAELPGESLIYYADSANAPYGSKSSEQVIGFSHDISEFLNNMGAKLIVVACNTATGIAINYLRDTYSIPFVGMEPAIKPAAKASKSGKIGVLATANTFETEHFNRTKGLHANNVEVLMTIGEGLVELVEQGKATSDYSKELLIKYLMPMVDEGIDHLVLGCTHYPFLLPLIHEIIPPEIQIHDPAPAVARQVRKVLEEVGELNPGNEKPQSAFFSSGNRTVLDMMVENALDSRVPPRIK
ncbi:MAG: glutamate racemase [Bacteroidales bacterium]|nr:glutamate racemase [Bacteroidales bacterium]